MLGRRSVLEAAGLVFAGLLAACGGEDMSADGSDLADEVAFEEEATEDAADEKMSSDAMMSSDEELGTSEQELLGLILPSSCFDITGTDPVLAALAVATATELRRWQPTKDFTMSWTGHLALTSTGKARCADGKCFNTQALLDLQKDAAKNAEIRPGIKANPLLIRTTLALAYARQTTCFSLLGLPMIGCGVPEHQFKLVGTNPGTCDTNYWFQVQNAAGAPLNLTEMKALEKGLVWVNAETNKYISFQVDGNTVGIDPTYGLNTTTATAAGSCSAACTKISATDITGQCCSCNGTKRYSRSSWSATTYLCK
jgi:hypothetical protein